MLEPERSPAKHALNVDGAFILDTCVGAVGAVVRGTGTFSRCLGAMVALGWISPLGGGRST